VFGTICLWHPAPPITVNQLKLWRHINSTYLLTSSLCCLLFSFFFSEIAQCSCARVPHVSNDIANYQILPFLSGTDHRRRSSVKFRGGKTFLPEKKLTKCPNFTWYYTVAVYWDITACDTALTQTSETSNESKKDKNCPKINKMSKFYMIFARKIFFSEFRGKCPHAPRLIYAFGLQM